MKTKFNIAWIDDNFNDTQMQSGTEQLKRKLKRKNGFSLKLEDVYEEVSDGDLDSLLLKISRNIDLSNSIDLVVVDCQLGGETTGEKIAKRFRDTLPSVDILFYSGKENVQDLRQILAKEGVDNVNCIGRASMVDGVFSVIENIIDRSYKISTLRGVILNSVCEMDQLIIDILLSYYSKNAGKKSAFVEEVASFIVSRIRKKTSAERTKIKKKLLADSIENLLDDVSITSGSLYKYLDDIKGDLGLNQQQTETLNKYQHEILDFRNSAAHTKETTCLNSGHAMLENRLKSVQYRKNDINTICKTIVLHEENIQSILDGMVQVSDKKA